MKLIINSFKDYKKPVAPFGCIIQLQFNFAYTDVNMKPFIVKRACIVYLDVATAELKLNTYECPYLSSVQIDADLFPKICDISICICL